MRAREAIHFYQENAAKQKKGISRDIQPVVEGFYYLWLGRYNQYPMALRCNSRYNEAIKERSEKL